MSEDEFLRALFKLYGVEPEPLPPVVLSEQQLVEWQERWDELWQSPATRELRILGVSDEEHERAKWERSVRNKLDSALLALGEGWGYEWDKPYEYNIPEATDV